MSQATQEQTRRFDVTICGGGLAGLALARQLNMRMPELSVLVIDKLSRPLPVACHKVGESTIEGGALYFSRVLALKDYLKQNQYPKLGLRFFWGSGRLPLEGRSEYGLSAFAPHSSVQLDRGTFESALRGFAEETGSTLWEGFSIDDLTLSETEDPHRVTCHDVASGEERVVESRWVIDASGRRQLIKRKLGLHLDHGRNHSAAWWRVKGRVDISDMVGPDVTEWHDRVPNKNRYFSTNHFLGDHYWVWLIPLATGHTSVGIVADEAFQPFDTYSTFAKAQTWLEKNEPHVAKLLYGHEPEDFLVMRRFTYSSKKMFSPHRWACVGEAGVFSDPYFSTGSDLIGAANCIVSELVRLDMQDKNLTANVVNVADTSFLTYSRFLTDNIQKLYDYNEQHIVGAARYLWGNIIGPPITLPFLVGFLHQNGCFSDKDKLATVVQVRDKLMATFSRLGQAMRTLFDDWAKMSPNTTRFDFIDYLALECVKGVIERACEEGQTSERLLANADATYEIAERLAQVIFLLAVEDVFPEQLKRFSEPVWLNASAISLHPDRWEADGLFQPATAPRELDALRREIRGLFSFAPRDASIAP